jgi:hypothetical protein
MKAKISVIALAVLGVSYFFYAKGVIPQDQTYHHFADSRQIFGIPNALDVVTNILFLLVAYVGLTEVSKNQKSLSTKRSWFWFFFSILLIGPGSAYYHWAPNDHTLIWDRLPMSMGFMAMYVALLSEHIDLKLEKLLPFSLLLGLFSVIVWAVTSDLRFYFIIQFSSFITIPLVLALFPSKFTMKIYYVIALGFYALAKWTEVKDWEIYRATHESMSGHSLKHVLAALGLLVLWWMIRERKLRIASA